MKIDLPGNRQLQTHVGPLRPIVDWTARVRHQLLGVPLPPDRHGGLNRNPYLVEIRTPQTLTRRMNEIVSKGMLHLMTEALSHRLASPDVPAPDGETALTHALQLGNVQAVQMLLAAGANVNAPRGDGTQPIFVAIEASQHGDVQPLMALLGHTEIDFEATNVFGQKPLTAAAVSGRLEALTCLLERLPPSAVGPALVGAAGAGQHAVLAPLLDQPVPEVYLQSAVSAAALAGHAQIVFSLVMHRNNDDDIRDRIGVLAKVNREAVAQLVSGDRDSGAPRLPRLLQDAFLDQTHLGKNSWPAVAALLEALPDQGDPLACLDKVFSAASGYLRGPRREVAELLGERQFHALTSEDPKAAQEMLSALSAQQAGHVLAAVVLYLAKNSDVPAEQGKMVLHAVRHCPHMAEVVRRALDCIEGMTPSHPGCDTVLAPARSTQLGLAALELARGLKKLAQMAPITPKLS